MHIQYNNLTLTVKEFLFAAGFRLSDDAFHSPVRNLDIEIFIDIRRVERHMILLPILLDIHFFSGCNPIIMNLIFNPNNNV